MLRAHRRRRWIANTSRFERSPVGRGQLSTMKTLEVIQPYVEQLFHDAEVQRQLARARRNLRAARSLARRAKSKRRAASDPQLWQRLLGGAGAALDAGCSCSPGSAQPGSWPSTRPPVRAC
jgi:hypothetical protein